MTLFIEIGFRKNITLLYDTGGIHYCGTSACQDSSIHCDQFMKHQVQLNLATWR